MSQNPAPARRAVWRDRDLALFAAARLVGVVGASVTAVAMPLLVYGTSGSAWWVSVVTASQVAPYLVFGLPAGAFADRVPRRRLMVSMQMVSALALAVIPVLALTGLPVPEWVAVTTSLVMASCFVWFDAAAFGALPRLAGRDRIVEANSFVWTGTTLVGIGAPALGGLLVAALGPEMALGVDVAAYLLTALLLLAVVRSMDPAATAETAATSEVGPAQWTRDVREGVDFIRSQPLVRNLTLVGFGNSVVAGGVTAVLVVLVADRVDGSAEGSFGLVLTVMAVGAFLAAAALPRLSRRVAVGRLTLISLTAGVPVVVGVAAAGGLVVLVGLLFVWSACTTLVVLNGITARQLVTPDHLQARVNTTARMLAWGGSPFGAVLAGAVTQRFGVATALSVAAAVLVVTAAAGWLSPLRSTRLGAAVPQ